jgi:D-amino-acid dehydrogenase
MKVVVLGAGVVGTASAWYLRQHGHEVTVIDRQSAAGMETSFANGGQIAVSHAEPWANPSAPAKVLKWIFREDAPLLFRLRADVWQWLWGAKFLRECLPARTADNIRQIVSLGTYSRDCLQALRRATGISYQHLEKGILHFFSNEREFAAADATTRLMRALGCDRRMMSCAEALHIEPALAPIADEIVGATFTAADESGDAHVFTQALAALAASQGVRWRFGCMIGKLIREGDRMASVEIQNELGHIEQVKADAFVLALGSFSAGLARQIGVHLDVYPAKGYSITVPITDDTRTFNVSLTDDEYKLVYSRLGNQMRIAGTAELNGYSMALNQTRCEAIVNRASRIFGRSGDFSRARYWAGLRPATPSNVPYIGMSKLKALFLNTGHGTLGWTHACGSGSTIAQIVSGTLPDIDFAFTPETFTLLRSAQAVLALSE